jgi:propanediol dehydratase small subunit
MKRLLRRQTFLFIFMTIFILSLLISGSFWLALLAVTPLLIYDVVCDPPALRAIKRRPCSGRHWRNAFPESSKEQLRQFVALCSVHFALFDRVDRLKIRPNDRIVDLCDASHADGAELEEFCLAIADHYQIHLEQQWHDDITFGRLLVLTQKRASAAV